MDSSGGPFSSFLKSNGNTANFFMHRGLIGLGGAAAGVGSARADHCGQQRPFVALSDKRNRNPNWTDGEIIRFLEMLQDEDTLRDLMAQRNKQVKNLNIFFLIFFDNSSKFEGFSLRGPETLLGRRGENLGPVQD